MANNDKLPPEILRKILEEVNVLDRSSWKQPEDVERVFVSQRGTDYSKNFSSIVEDYAKGRGSMVKVALCRPHGPRMKRINILNAMRVCRYWRNMAFSIMYKEDVSNWKWTANDWTVCQRMMQLRELENLMMHGPTSWDVPVTGRRGTRKPGWGMWEQGDRW